ncbi:Non-specific lipid-transfer protein-like protein [Striga hermonthica]|uniref:Non-specific lipid-transfer protein-like protein n=1 Tax=Striga hermonthica TaxID=68872 RepID=A0A9N7NKJ5_STRHE|nr:Non-specific lipid-transfer protein-like protein [Striga hermonthica]
MANKHTTTTDIIHRLMVAAVLAVALPGAAAQSPALAPGMPDAAAPSPGLDCFTYLVNLSDCLTFVEGGSNLTRPDPGCCSELANLVDTQPICLCQLLGNPDQVGFPVDVSRALRLPSVCNVTTPPVSLCAGALAPSEAPSYGALASSEAPSAGGGPVAAASPSPGDGQNGGSSNLGCNFKSLIGFAALVIIYFF